MTAKQKLVLDETVAKILAQRYWDGAHDRHGVKALSFQEYWGLSRVGWLGAAAGIVHLVNPSKRKKNAR